MSTDTTTSFDLDAFARGFETWDTEGILDLYADDVELTQIGRRPRTGVGRNCTPAAV